MTNPSSDTDFIEHFDPELTIAPEEYEPYVGKNQVEDLKRLAEPPFRKGMGEYQFHPYWWRSS